MDLWAEAAPCLKDMLFLPGCTRTPHRKVGATISIIITGHRDIPSNPPRLGVCGRGGAGEDVPRAITRTPHRKVSATIPVIITGHRDIPSNPPRLGVCG